MSSKKRARTSLKRFEYNKAIKSRVKTFIRKFNAAEGDQKAVAYRLAASELDRAANKGVIHPNKAARTKSRMAKRMLAEKA
ncbi:MAG TPA: 30S ribosomal protein S20 [Firmicutes bacterium]|nr:30S ribosomal protein S20 [Bacillota bacterium]